MSHLGDFDTSKIIYGKFATFRPSTGATFTLAGTPAISVYKDNSTTQSTAGITLTADFDGVTGLNHFAIDTSADGTFYSSGSFFDIVITTGTVDSVSVVGAVVGSFSLRNNSALKPTTAARTLDVSAGGEAGVDWANVGSPTTTLALTGTSIDPASIRTAVGLATANLDTQLTAIDDFIDTEVAAIKAKTDQLVFTVAGQVDSNALGMANNLISASKIATAAIDADSLAADFLTGVSDAILDRNMATGTDSGSPTVRTIRQALRSLRNRVNIAAGTATVYKEDDATASWTAAISTTAGNPISQVDPA